MYRITKTAYGHKIVLQGALELEELRRWLEEIKQMVDSMPESFSVFVDTRHLSLLTPEKQQFLKEAQTYTQQHGLLRSVTIVDSTLTKMQQRQIAQRSGVDNTKLIIDAAHEPDWNQKALMWLATGVYE